MMNLDYQTAVNLAGAMLQAAMPYAVVFGIVERLANMVVSMITGKKRIEI